jgi:phosphosulfolactate synthase (CoM biosynthesis protein A)
MELDPAARAFSDILPIVEPRPKPRNVGLTEVRTPAMGVGYHASYAETVGDYLDSVKWTVGTQRLVTREKVLEINTYLHEHQIEVSSGGLLESVIPHGEKAVRAFIEESAELGFDIIEVSSGALVISLDEKCQIVKAVADTGLKPKPEVFGASPIPGGYGLGNSYVSAAKIIRECEAVLEAGAWKIMIEEDGVFDGGNPDKWNRDLAWALATKIPQEYLFWEASSMALAVWLIAQFGPDVNLFTGPEWLGYLASFRAGVFGPTAGRIGGFNR